MPELPFKILGVEHIGIAVNDLNGVSDIFGDLLGLEIRGREKIDDQQVITDIYHAGKDKLEFLKPTSPNSPITKFASSLNSVMSKFVMALNGIKENK